VVVGAVAASAAFDFSRHGIAVIGPVPGGLPYLRLPDVGWGDVRVLLPVAASCFLMIVAQSAATARVYATRHRQALDEDADLVGLSAANAVAALSGTFVVNGSPTQTAMVEGSGGRSQLAHLATAAVVAVVLLVLTGPLQYHPQCVLGALVFTIAVGLIDVRGLRDIARESRGEFVLALATAAVVVLVGVEEGILLAMVLSLLRHVRHSYRPHTAVLVEDKSGPWRQIPAVPGARSGPGLVIYRFGERCSMPTRVTSRRRRERWSHGRPSPCAGSWSMPARSRTWTIRPRGRCGSSSKTWPVAASRWCSSTSRRSCKPTSTAIA